MTRSHMLRFCCAAAAFLSAAESLRAVTLEVALARTVERNPTIQEAKLRLEEAAGQRLVLRAIALPQARILTLAGVQGGERSGEDEVRPFVFARGDFAQPLFNMAIPASYRRGRIEVLLAQQRLNIAAVGQLHSARVAFHTAAYNDAMRALGESQRQRLESNFIAQNERYQAGKADSSAVATARLLEQELKPRIEAARRISNGALLQLAQAMGENLSAALPRPEGTLQFAPVSLQAKTGAAIALKRRPDLQLARLMVRAAGEDQRIIEAAYYPAVSGTLSGDYIPASEIRRGNEGTARRSDDIISSEMRFGGAFTWRVVDNGMVRGAAVRQRAIREINELVLARLEAEVPRELERIENNLRALQARHDSLAKAVTVAEQTVADVQSSLSEGLSSQLEYRTAESSFLETKAGVLTVAFEQQMALAAWDRATGRYFQFSDDTNAKLH